MPLPLFLGIAAVAAAGAKVVKNQVEKSQATDTIIAEAEARCAKEATEHTASRNETEFQKKMRRLLLQKGFSSDTIDTERIYKDWKCIPKEVEIAATRKGSLLSWGEHAVYTFDALYYQCRKNGIHELLYYDYINDFDTASGIVDYGPNHQKRSIAHWGDFEKRMIEQINHIWRMDSETDTSILEFCFNHCHDFHMELGFFKTNQIRSAFRKYSKGKHGVIQKNWDHIKIVSMNGGKIELQFWMYFPKVESVTYSDADTEEDIRRKEWEQEELMREAEEREYKVYQAHEMLLGLKSDVGEVFQQALYSAYGVMFKKENIILIEEPDFTHEGPSFLDRVEGVANTAQNAYSKMADITQKRMDEARRDYERKNKS